ncbi:hypothetical protein [Paenibacillus bouchesdurhonensis]|uniref:hypothetical protein n=1 Tax=Paenibacillus bouchesdurhonensis TaxID=1870990 RepID=UPI000DA604F6|nr:hypothetical protein [Paenibacillus bouchesdurhonensis]
MREQIRQPLQKGLLAAVIALSPYAAVSETVLANNKEVATPEGLPDAAKLKQPNPHHHHHHKRHSRGGHIIKDTAELLETEPRVLVEELKQGKSLLQVVQTRKGWSEAEYIQKLTVVVTKHIDKAAAEGRLSKEKAQSMKIELPVKLKKIVNRTWKSPTKGHPVTDYRNNTIQLHMTE